MDVAYLQKYLSEARTDLYHREPFVSEQVAMTELSTMLGLTVGETYRSLWQADHIVPVVEGGGSCRLDNLRILCVWCHKEETRALAKRRAEQRRALQRLPL